MLGAGRVRWCENFSHPDSFFPPSIIHSFLSRPCLPLSAQHSFLPTKMHHLQSPTMPNCSPIRYKREIHLPSVESILHCETDARYRYMPSYRPSKVFRYQPYPQCRQRYVTMDENLVRSSTCLHLSAANRSTILQKVISDRYEDDFRVIFGPYILVRFPLRWFSPTPSLISYGNSIQFMKKCLPGRPKDPLLHLGESGAGRTGCL